MGTWVVGAWRVAAGVWRVLRKKEEVVAGRHRRAGTRQVVCSWLEAARLASSSRLLTARVEGRLRGLSQRCEDVAFLWWRQVPCRHSSSHPCRVAPVYLSDTCLPFGHRRLPTKGSPASLALSRSMALELSPCRALLFCGCKQTQRGPRLTLIPTTCSHPTWSRICQGAQEQRAQSEKTRRALLRHIHHSALSGTPLRLPAAVPGPRFQRGTATKPAL
jgi:hypothetical protein